ncbi:MAG: 3'-5' exonuclease, partial [Burkholderiales bacterium]|nr:3'-5' exonuclease [Burkholderiales bacterium]
MLDRDVVYVDLETTGATAQTDRITEIGIVEIAPDGTASEWSTLVNPGRPIPPFIEGLTGISDAMVATAPPFADLADALHRRLDGKLLVAHNARFDYGFLRSEFARIGLTYRSPVLCTVKLSRRLYPAERRHNLDSIMLRH